MAALYFSPVLGTSRPMGRLIPFAAPHAYNLLTHFFFHSCFLKSTKGVYIYKEALAGNMEGGVQSIYTGVGRWRLKVSPGKGSGGEGLGKSGV